MNQTLKSWEMEKQSAFLYQKMATYEVESSIGDLFSKLAVEAEKQAALWETKLREQRAPVPDYRPSFRAKIIAWLIPRFGPAGLRRILSAAKLRGLSVYSAPRYYHPSPNYVKDVGRRHRAASQGNNLRASVFGINDGLVSNASLVLGVAGASMQNQWILLAGIAGLLAGAFSMAAGEYVSVRSQREMLEHQLGLEREELEQYPQEEAEELALIYEAKGVPKEEAEKLAQQILKNPDLALDTLAREELGLDPEELGSPWAAALTSFFSFAVGAVVPLLPFLGNGFSRPLEFSVAFTAIGLFVVGSGLGFFTGKSFLWSGIRMLLIGAAAGLATFGIGKLLGVHLS